MAENEVTTPESASEAADQEVDSSALEAAVDQAVEAGVVQSAIVTKRCSTDDVHAVGSLVEKQI